MIYGQFTNMTLTNLDITEMTPTTFYYKNDLGYFCDSLLARQNGIRLEGEIIMQPELFIM
jgi:hypothetical protein